MRRFRRFSLAVAVATLGPLSALADGPLSFFTVTPCRLADTRNPPGANGGPALSAGTNRAFSVTGLCGIPSAARAVTLTVTVVQPTGQGRLTLFPTDEATPATSTINFSGNDFATATGVVMPISDISGAVSVFTFLAAGGGTVHLVLDVTGYFAP